MKTKLVQLSIYFSIIQSFISSGLPPERVSTLANKFSFKRSPTYWFMLGNILGYKLSSINRDTFLRFNLLLKFEFKSPEKLALIYGWFSIYSKKVPGNSLFGEIHCNFSNGWKLSSFIISSSLDILIIYPDDIRKIVIIKQEDLINS